MKQVLPTQLRNSVEYNKMEYSSKEEKCFSNLNVGDGNSFLTILCLRLFIPYDFVFTFVYCVYKSIGNQQAAELGHPISH
jgi:hypothetical protein